MISFNLEHPLWAWRAVALHRGQPSLEGALRCLCHPSIHGWHRREAWRWQEKFCHWEKCSIPASTSSDHAFRPRFSATPSGHVFRRAIRIEDVCFSAEPVPLTSWRCAALSSPIAPSLADGKTMNVTTPNCCRATCPNCWTSFRYRISESHSICDTSVMVA